MYSTQPVPLKCRLPSTDTASSLKSVKSSSVLLQYSQISLSFFLSVFPVISFSILNRVILHLEPDMVATGHNHFQPHSSHFTILKTPLWPTLYVQRINTLKHGVHPNDTYNVVHFSQKKSVSISEAHEFFQ